MPRFYPLHARLQIVSASQLSQLTLVAAGKTTGPRTCTSKVSSPARATSGAQLTPPPSPQRWPRTQPTQRPSATMATSCRRSAGAAPAPAARRSRHPIPSKPPRPLIFPRPAPPAGSLAPCPAPRRIGQGDSGPRTQYPQYSPYAPYP